MPRRTDDSGRMPTPAEVTTVKFWNHVAEEIEGSVLTMSKEELLSAGLEESHLLLGGFKYNKGRLLHTGTICVPNNSHGVVKKFLNLYRQYFFLGAELDVVERPTPEFYLYFDVDWKIPTDCAAALLDFAVHMAKQSGVDTATHRFKMGSEARWRSGQCGPIEEYIDHLVSLAISRRLQTVAKEFFPLMKDKANPWYVAVATVENFARTWKLAQNRTPAMREKNKQTTKIGIHVHFTNLLVTKEQAREIRAYAVRDFCVVFGEVPAEVILAKGHTTGSFWDEAIDDSVYDSGLRMLGSMKPTHDRKALDHTRIYDMTMLLDGKTGMDNRSRFAIDGARDTRFRKCSIRCSDIITRRDKVGKKINVTRHEEMLGLGYKIPELFVGLDRQVAPITDKAFRSMFGEDKLDRIKRKHIELGFPEEEAAKRAAYEMEMHHANHMFAGGMITNSRGKRIKAGTVRGKVTTLYKDDERYRFATDFVQEHMHELHPEFDPDKIKLTGVRLYKSSAHYHDLQVQTDSRLCMNRIRIKRGERVIGLGEHENRRSASLYFIISKWSGCNTKLDLRQGCYSQSAEPNQRRFGMACNKWCTSRSTDPVAHIVPIKIPEHVGVSMFPDCQPSPG